ADRRVASLNGYDPFLIAVVANNELDDSRYFTVDALDIRFQFWIDKNPVGSFVIELNGLRGVSDRIRNYARLHSQAANIRKCDIALWIFGHDADLVTVLQIDTHQSAFI